MNSRIEKNNDIEVLRALAVLMVIIAHAQNNLINWTSPGIDLFYRYFSGGVGVDLFFVISGFVIARGFVFRLSEADGADQRTATVLAFWVRRFYRIIPLAWLWLAIILMATLFLNESGVFGSFSSNWGGAIAAVLQVANIRFQDCFMHYECGASFVYWSLSLEEQFYIALPIMVLLFKRYFPHVLVMLLAYQLFFSSGYNFAFRFEGLLFGVLLALFSKGAVYKQAEPSFMAERRYSSYFVLGFLIVLLFSVHANSLKVVPSVMQFKLAAVLSLILVWIASYKRTYFLPNSNLSVVFLWVGSRSYALYLVHIPVFFLVRELWFRQHGDSIPIGTDVYGYVSLAVASLVIFSELSYRLVETPMRIRGIGVSTSILKKSEPSEPSESQVDGELYSTR